MRRIALALFLFAVPLAAGCGGDEDEGGGDGAAEQSIELSASDFKFDPNELDADAGGISFVLTNDGDSQHALEIEGGGVEESSDTIGSGDSTTLTVNLEEGTYEIYCPVGDHKDRGMVGTLTVGGGGAGGAPGEIETETGETEGGAGY